MYAVLGKFSHCKKGRSNIYMHQHNKVVYYIARLIYFTPKIY